MTSHAPIPANIPGGMTHVGWRCTNPDHLCLRALSDVSPNPEVDQVRWDHGAEWAPVFAFTDDLR